RATGRSAACCPSSSPWRRLRSRVSPHGWRGTTSPRRRAGRKHVPKRRYGLWLAAGAGYAFLYLPLIIVIAYSFNDSRLNAEWVGFTPSWYKTLFADDDMILAAGNSLIIAAVASFLSTVLGTAAGVAMHRYPSRLLSFLVLAPIAIPEILMGVSLLIF